MTQNQQIWLAIVAIVALYLWNQNKTRNRADLSDPRNQLPLAAAGLPKDVFASVISMQGPSIQVGF